ncbi:MAG: HAMP domain-containing protein [Treponema sp.]|jgi:class 3 adenylate cyclase/HAMP domain-containing protein|nr:HAMP domain-containing protein [Treponema sp.]
MADIGRSNTVLPEDKHITKRRKYLTGFGICLAVFFCCLAVVLLNLNILKRPVFQIKTDISAPASAKYEKDSNLYIIDNTGFRLICMTTEGNINYTINIDKMKEYTRFYDMAVDEMGNLYVYAMEVENDAFLTKRDIIRKYDRSGKLVQNILVIEYDENSEDRPHVFPQFGSMRCEEGVLTFSRVRRELTELYVYNTYREDLAVRIFFHGGYDYSIGRLALKDFDNFVYTTRDGDIYEVKDGGAPRLRASCTFTEDEGGIIPWYPAYDSRGDIIFIDMFSSILYRLDESGAIREVLPNSFFDDLRSRGAAVGLVDYGFWQERFAGVFGEHVWYYDIRQFKIYDEGVTLPMRERLSIIAAQVSLALGAVSFILAIYLLFMRILDRYISLLIKQTVFIIPLTLAAFAAIYMFTFNFMLERLNGELINELSLLTEVYSGLINGDDLDALKTTKDCNSEAYQNVLEMTKKAVGDNKKKWNKAFYAAVYKLIGTTEYFVVLSNDEANLFRPYGLVIEEGTDEYTLLTEGKPFTSFTVNYTGSWVYSNFPVYNSRGEISGIFEIGLDLTGYDISNQKQMRDISVIAALIALVIMIALIVVVSIVVGQLAVISQVVKSITQGDYSVRVKYRGRDELGLVSLGLNLMAEELQHQIQYIKKVNESTIRFVPIQFMEYLGVTDITKMKLGDYVRRDLSVLFFDIRSFSIHSEILSVQENFLFINRILNIAGPILRSHNGFVDKFIGDAAMALFADARDAVRAGIEIYRRVVLDKATRIKIGADGINIGVGIHTGSVMMGIVGEPERLSSTVISKNVNLASRVESLTKQTKSGMLITRDTMNQIPGDETEFQYRFIGMIQAAGVNEVIGLFDVLDALPESIRKRRLATKKIFESGIRKYHTREYKTALMRFKQVVAADPYDVCAATCLAETKRHLMNPNLPSVFIYDKK